MFKPIPGFTHYQINELGEVKSLSRSICRTDGKIYDIPEKILKPYLKKGKPYVQLHADGKKVCRSISSLMKEVADV